MSTITKERVAEFIKNPLNNGLTRGEQMELARIALASLEAEPVGTFRNGPCGYSPSFHEDAVPLYTAPPAPVALPSGYSDFEEIWSSSTHPLTQDDEMKDFAWDIWNACRAAMLHGADVSLTHEGKNHHEDKLGMVNHLGDVTEKVEPVTQIEPVADLYGLTSPTGGETSFTFDAVEARDFIDGGWSCQEYVELERFQEAVSGNSPVIQDGWVMVPVEPTEDMIVNGFESEPDESFSDEKEWEAYEAMSGCQQAAHRAKLCWAAMIAAAPKLE